MLMVLAIPRLIYEANPYKSEQYYSHDHCRACACRYF
jgi:hypothetical protein